MEDSRITIDFSDDFYEEKELRRILRKLRLRPPWDPDMGVPEYPFGYLYRFPLPYDLELDEDRIPVDPFWRVFFYRRLFEPSCPLPEYSGGFGDESIMLYSSVANYYHILMKFYEETGIDLRQYRSDNSGTSFNIPLPPAEYVPRDKKGFPINNYWLLLYCIRMNDPNFLIPPYDRQGIPFRSRKIEIYQLISNIEFDRVKFLKLWARGIPMDHPDMIVRSYIHWCFDSEIKKYERKPYAVWESIAYKAKMPLASPTLPDLALAYIETKNSPHPKLPEDKFPNGFTAFHHKCLVKCATPRILRLLQHKLPYSDPLISEILLKFKKTLPNSPYFLI
ncbi:hypothetical protein [Candidatus Harpocratesius sp.]